MAATKAGPRSGIPTSSRFGYSGGTSLKAPSPATAAAGNPNGSLVSAPTPPKSQLAFNPNRKPGLSGRTESNSSTEGLVHVGKHNGYPESLSIKADVYIKPPNSTPSSRLNSPVNTTYSGLQAPSKDKLVNNSTSKLHYSSQLHDLAKRREQSQSPKTIVSDQEPVNDTAAGHLASLALAEKKRHLSDSTIHKCKSKQIIPSPLRESNKIDISQHNSSLKLRRGNSPHSTLLKQDKTLNHITDNPSSAFQAPGKFNNRQMLREPAEKNKRLSSSSSGSDDAALPSAFQKVTSRADQLKTNGSQQKLTGIPQAYSPSTKASSDDVDGASSKSKLKPQHHILPMSSGLQAKSDSNSAYGSQPQRSMLLPRSNANQNNMLTVARATSPPHAKPNMLPRVIKMKNSNQAKQQEDLKTDHNANARPSPLLMNNGELVEKSSQPIGHSSLPVSHPMSNNTTAYYSSSNMQPPVALVKNNLLDEANDTDSCVSETGSESTIATVVMGKNSSIADLTSLDSSLPSKPESSNGKDGDLPQLSPPLNANEFPPYFSHNTKLLGKLQNMGFDTGSGENSPTLQCPPKDVTAQNHSESEHAYSEEDVATALDAITTHSDKTTKVPSSSANDSSYGHHIASPQLKSNLEPKSSVLPKPKDAEALKDLSKTMSLPATARYDGLLRFSMKRDKPGKSSERVSPERSTELDGQTVSHQKRSLHGLAERRERNKTIAFSSKEFLKSSEDKSMVKPIGGGLKLYSPGKSEQEKSETALGKGDVTQSNLHLKLRALSPPHTTSGLVMPNGSVLKDGKANLDALRKKTFIRKPTAEGCSDIAREKEPSLVKPNRSDVDHASLSKVKSAHSAFTIPSSESSASQPDDAHQQFKPPVQQFMVPSPLTPTFPIDTVEEHTSKSVSVANKPTGGHERSVSPSKVVHEYHNAPNPDSRKPCDGENSMSNAIHSSTRTKSPSPVQKSLSKDPSNVDVALMQSSFSYDDSNKAQEASTMDERKSTDVFMSAPDDTMTNNWIEGHNDAAGSSKSVVGETSTESIGVLQSAMLTDHNLPHVLDDVQRVEIVNDRHKHSTLPVNEPSNDHLSPQTEHSSGVGTGVPDPSLLNNVVIDKVAASVDSMGSHVDSTAVNTHSSIDRSQYGETLLETEQEAASIMLPQLNIIGTAASKQEDDENIDEEDDDDDDEEEDDDDIISNTLKLSPEAQEQSDLLADDRSDVLSCISHVSDRSYASSFSSFRMKPYMPAHVVAEGSYLEQRKRESFAGNDRTDFLENDRYDMSPQLHHRTALSKRPNSELGKPSHFFQSDPNLDLRTSDSRSPTYFDRYTPEHQFRDPELQELRKLIASYDKQVNSMKTEIDHKNKLLMSYERNMSEMSSKLHKLSANLEDKNAEILQLQEDREKWPANKRHGRKKSEEGVLSDGYLSDTGMDNSQSSTKKKKRPWRHISLRRKRNPNLAEPVVSSQVPRRQVDDQNDHDLLNSGSERDKLINQLISLREDLNLLKTENSLLKHPSVISSKLSSSVPSLTNSTLPEPLLVEVKPIQVHVDYSGGVKVAVTVQVGSSGNKAQDHVLLGTIRVSPDCNWPTMDHKIYAILEHHLSTVDAEEKLGLSIDGILYYTMDSSVKRVPGSSSIPHCSPYYALGQKTISIILKGASQGSCAVLAYHVLINEKTLQSYVSLLLETKCLVLMGTKGSCKTSLANYVGKHLVFRMSDQDDGRIISFNVAAEGYEKVIDRIKHDVGNSLEPTVLVLDDVSEYNQLESILTVAALLHQRPYIIAVFSSGLIKGNALHHLLFNHQVRVITCSPDTEPVKNVLARSLRKNVLCLKNQNSSTDLLLDTLAAWLPTLLIHLNYFIGKFHFGSLSLGPRVFLNCPLNSTPTHIEMWFINLWNHFIIPYLTATTLDGIKQYGVDAKVEWIDVRDWVLDTYPWKNSSDMKNLNTVTREDVGFIQALRQQKQSSPASAGSQQSLQDSSKHSHQSNEELPMTPLSSKMESML